MSMRYRREGGESYLTAFPRFRHWVVECAVCHRQGHRPELPKQLGIGIAAQTIRQHFRVLKLNAEGMCEDCVAIKDRLGALPDPLPDA